MENNTIKKLDDFLNTEKKIKPTPKIKDVEINNDSQTITMRDGIVERINKKFITTDGRQLLQD